MKHQKKILAVNIFAGFFIGLSISFLAILIERLQHNLDFNSFFQEFHHFTVPVLIGLAGCIIGFLYGKKRLQQTATYLELQKTQQEYDTITSNIFDVIAIMNNDGIVTYKSPNVFLHFGWKPEELVGKSGWLNVHADDVKNVQETFMFLMKEENRTTEIECRYRCKNGNYNPIRVKAINLSKNPNIRGVLFNYHDISKRKQVESELRKSELKYRTLFENMIDVVCILDMEGNIISLNEAASELYEYSKEELLRMNIDELVHPEDRDKSSDFLHKLKTDGFYEQYEGRIITKTGKIIWIQVSSTSIYKDNTLSGSQDIIRDISVQKQLELSLRNTSRKLSTLNATKDKFFSIIAHDLKTPFNSLLGLSEMLANNIDEFEPKKIKVITRQFYSTTKSTYELLINLLQWSMSQRGKMVYKPETINLNDVFEKNIALFNHLADKKKISIINELSEKLTVTADKNMIMSIIRNLISNAIKFTEVGGNIKLTADKDQEATLISVSDNGVGMSEDVKTSLFKLASNISTKGTNNESGTGLGLILCKEFIDKHNGEIWVDSQSGEGSKCTFSIPNSIN